MKRIAKWFGAIFALMFVANVLMVSLGFAQEAAPGPEVPMWKALLDMAVKSLVPALWVAVGPVAVAFITSQVNKLNTYVPRPIQVVLSGLVAAVGAGLTGDASGAVTGLVGGSTAQIYAATNPKTLLTTEQPD